MSNHHHQTESQASPLSLSDIETIALCQGHHLTQSKHTFNQQAVYKIDHQAGLYTLNELKAKLLH